ncbi:putative protein C17H9,06c OS=Schizosaccharomyces pombe (strain 972 / ATCC 24843) GN=SPAC17H9.06c PE=1 SV=1 [Rhizoctonia solani AG-1 IB]|uniref:DUF4211 domain-containing protein n=1 Tax=Thanatephorus cucumeris (strain AG1-IB / isolate 7/3/14) TaxID=1108050 RepID=A0A0B7F5R8_THACB|nr:putative protein C17H9,06c OS=Schizosaccharomyces pombe (strain 972 / ATCC 24843) GN=SPAC17H9.06c PE=1 SV=1 [Rhizoctonia solani AG-1 IB]
MRRKTDRSITCLTWTWARLHSTLLADHRTDMPPKPLPSSPSSLIILTDSDSDEPKFTVKGAMTVITRGAGRELKRKRQTTLADFSKSSKGVTSASGTGAVKSGRHVSTRPGPASSPVRRARVSPTKSSKSSARKSNSSPVKAKSEENDEDVLAATDSSVSTEADVGAVQFEGRGIRPGRRLSRVMTIDEEESGVTGGGTANVSSDDAKPETEDEDEEKDEDVAPRRLAKRKAVVISLSDSEEEDAMPLRRRIARRQPAEQEDLSEQEDDDDPMDGLDDEVVLDSRLRGAPQRNSKRMELRENLARLKRRKLGQDTPPPTEHSSSEEEEEEEETVVRPRGRRLYKPIPGARPSQPTLQEWMDGSDDDEPQVEASRSLSFSGDEEESGSSDNDSWIEDDTNNGATSAILPEGYSMLGHQSLAHHFKDEQNDQYFGLSLRALRRKMDGLRDSLVTSSVWTSGFKKALNTHPELDIVDLKFAVSGCGACRISTRLSTFKGSLAGDDYDRDTFETIQRRSSSVDSDESDSEESNLRFDLGRFCRARVRCYHDFVHWEWHLFELVSNEIETLKTAHRRKDPASSRAQRPAANDPDGIMNWLDGRGIVQQEWSRLEQLMDKARGLDYKKDNDVD